MLLDILPAINDIQKMNFEVKKRQTEILQHFLKSLLHSTFYFFIWNYMWVSPEDVELNASSSYINNPVQTHGLSVYCELAKYTAGTQ
jgi:hypothetical protein